jgi:hypothetical protein
VEQKSLPARWRRPQENGRVIFGVFVSGKLSPTSSYNSTDEALLLPVEVILSYVCSEWRNIMIAINLPCLWMAFKFKTCCLSAPVEKLQEYLVRSKIKLVKLYFDMYGSAFDLQGANQCWDCYFSCLSLV